jgi:hypothetical protein
VRRTFVLSDAHGHPELIEQALDHGGFRPGQDHFVYAGDLLDRGPDSAGCIELVQRYATEVLVGNHEMAVMLDFDMWGTDWDSREFRQLLLDKVLGAAPPLEAAPDAGAPPRAAAEHAAPGPDAWKVATCHQGVLITHAGVSTRYQAALDQDCHGDPVQLAAYLNAEFLAAVRRELETGEWDEDGILGRSGPLWFRPLPYADRLPLAGVRQVVGHTPPQPELEAHAFWMVDPCVWMSMMDASWRVRCAVIEDGGVNVVERSLARSAA